MNLDETSENSNVMTELYSKDQTVIEYSRNSQNSNIDEVDAVFNRGQFLTEKKGGSSLIHEKCEDQVRNKVTKIKIIRLLFGCGNNQSNQYNIFDLIFNIGSMSLYIVDVVTDVINALYYYRNQDHKPANQSYFIYTISIIILSSLVLQLYSFAFERDDKKRKNRKQRNQKNTSCANILFLIIHILQLAPVLRYIRVIKLGINSVKMKASDRNFKENILKKTDWQWRRELSDINHIRLVESFMEAAPQLVLQIYIMIDSKQTPFVTVVSCVFSLLGFATVYVSYQRSIREMRPNPKYTLTLIGCLLILLYQSFTVFSRVLALALLLNANAFGFVICFFSRLLLSWICVVCLKVNYCRGYIKKAFDALVIGMGYNFTYVNVKEGNKNKYRMSAYYILTLIENISYAILWYYFRDSNTGLTHLITKTGSSASIDNKTALHVASLVPIVNIFGILIMIIYYICFHPRLGLSCFRSDVIEDKIEMTSYPNIIENKEYLKPTSEEPSSLQLYQTWPRLSSSSSRHSSSDDLSTLSHSRTKSQMFNFTQSSTKIKSSNDLLSSTFPNPSNRELSSTSLLLQPDHKSKTLLTSPIPPELLIEDPDDVERLLEEKRQQKAVIQQKQAWLHHRIDMQKRLKFQSDFQPLFPSLNRTSLSPSSPITTLSPIRSNLPKTFYTSSSPSSYDQLQLRCKTYPRKRPSHPFNHTSHNSPLLKELMKQRMVSIAEDSKLTNIPSSPTPAATYSLNDIALRHHKSAFTRPMSSVLGVSRTMSFTVRHDEVIDSIESSL